MPAVDAGFVRESTAVNSLALLAYMHVGFRMFDAKGDAGTGLDREYEAAVKMRRER